MFVKYALIPGITIALLFTWVGMMLERRRQISRERFKKAAAKNLVKLPRHYDWLAK